MKKIVSVFMVDRGSGFLRSRLAIRDEQKWGCSIVLTIRRQAGK